MFSPVALLVVAMMSGAVSVAVLGSLLHTGIPGLFRWIGANVTIIVALVLLALHSRSPGRLDIVVASALLAGAALVVLQGCRQFFGLRAVRPHELAAYILLLGGLLYWTYGSPNTNARVFVMSAFLAYVRLVIGWTLYRLRPPDRPKYSYLFVAAVAALGALVHLARGLASVPGWGHHAGLLDATAMNVAFFGLGILTMPCLSIGVVMLAYDRMAEKLQRLATIDELTGALVRREFMALAEAQLNRAKGTGLPLSIAILDIDDFKAINDGHGHAAGDEALRHFSAIVSRRVRTGDLFGRLGGEEFAVLLPAVSKSEAVALMNTLRIEIAGATLPIPSGNVACTFSAGVDEYRAGESLANLMARADAALYLAKGAGRNRVMAALPHLGVHARASAGRCA